MNGPRHLSRWRLATGFAAVTLLLGACAGPAQELTSLDDDLADAAATAAATDGRLRLHEVTDPEWDRLQVFPPYTSREDVREEIGVRMPAAAHRRMDSDSDVFLAFVEDEDLVAWALLGRGRIVVPPSPGTYDAEAAVFVVEPRGGGKFALREAGNGRLAMTRRSSTVALRVVARMPRRARSEPGSGVDHGVRRGRPGGGASSALRTGPLG